MYRRFYLGILAGLCCLTLLPQVSQADEAEDIFQRCVSQVRSSVERCVQGHHQVVRECRPRIRELLTAGRTAAARELAERCIHKINQDTRECGQRINRLCEECIHALRELEAFALADRLRERCDQALQTIERSRAAAVQQIRELF